MLESKRVSAWLILTGESDWDVKWSQEGSLHLRSHKRLRGRGSSAVPWNNMILVLVVGDVRTDGSARLDTSKRRNPGSIRQRP